MKSLKNLFFLSVLMVAVAACNKLKTPSGYAYTLHKAGTGAKANVGDAAFYDVILAKDDSVLFSTIKEGERAKSLCEDPKKNPDPFFKLTMEALQILKVGDSATFVMSLDTFKTKPAGLEGGKIAKLTIVLRDVKGKAQMEARQKELQALGEAIKASAPFYVARQKAVLDSATTLAKAFGAGKLPANVQTLPSGLQFAVLREGTGAVPKKGEIVLAHYYGCLKDGKKFDESYSKGDPFNFPVGGGRVIPAWDEGFMQLKEGSTAVLFVPSKLGYGAQSKAPIPANSDLVFYVDLIKSVDVEK